MLIVSQIQFVRPGERGGILNLYCIWVKKQQGCLFYIFMEENKDNAYLCHGERNKENDYFVKR